MAAPEALPGLMARCFDCLESQGIGSLELSAMALQDATVIARQLAFENITDGAYLVEAVWASSKWSDVQAILLGEDV